MNPNAPAPAPQQAAAPDAANNFAAAPSAGTGGGGTFSPTMFGDLISRNRINHTVTTIGPNGSPTTKIVASPDTSAGSFKLSDNGSPRPQDRVYFIWNYFNDVSGNYGSGDSFTYNRETFGIEKTFLDGNASLGMRLPFNQGSQTGFGEGSIGDITLYGVYAFVNDRETGNVVSGGLVLTLPTGPAFRDDSGRDINNFVFQPYLGYCFNAGDFFVQGIHSALLSEQQCAVSQDVAFGWWMSRRSDGLIRGVIPSVELHLYTPIDHPNRDGAAIAADNILTVTTGVTFGIGERTSLGFAFGVPITGASPNSYEAITTLNIRY